MKHNMMSIALLLLNGTSNMHSAPSQVGTTTMPYTTIPMIHDLELQQKTSLYRLGLLPAILIVVAYFQSSNIQEMIYAHPIPFTAMSYLLGNFFIDTFSKYKKIHETLQLLLFSQTMNRYMLSALAIKNNMQDIYAGTQEPFSEELFFQKLKIYTGYNFEELEQFTAEIIHNCLLFVHDLCLNPYIENINEQIYGLMKNKVTLDQILLVSSSDHELYYHLQQFNQHPEKNYEIVLEKLGLLIKNHINCFIKKNLHVLHKNSYQ